MKTILHIMREDKKFSAGYINFMKLIMNDWHHVFVILDRGAKVTPVDQHGIFWIKSFTDLLFNEEILKVAKAACKIILSGFVGCEHVISFFSSESKKKLFIQLWGGDFYELAKLNEDVGLDFIFRSKLKLAALKECVGLLFMINGEYKRFIDITGIIKDHDVLTIPGDPLAQPDFNVLREKRNMSGVIRVVVGNSAHSTLFHEKVFHILSRYSSIEIICPLSYGVIKYREHVLKVGKAMFGKSFIPILDMKSKQEYAEILASADVGIFYNDIQQAMGNVNLMLGLGKKVFIKQDTSGWEFCKFKGYKVFNAYDIPKLDIDDFVYFENVDRDNNMRIYDAYFSRSYVRERWQEFFMSDSRRWPLYRIEPGEKNV